jgi:hypothetical protein
MLDCMFDRCRQTLDASSRQLRCWVKSFKHDAFYPYPLERLRSKAAEQKYFDLWKRFFYYVFRVSAMSEEARSEIYGLILNEQQQRTISRIWQALDENTGDCVESDLEEESEEETDEESESKTAFIQDDRRRLASGSGVSVDDTSRILE